MYFCRAGSSCQWELLNTGISVALLVGIIHQQIVCLPVGGL
ncbi:hypothetical protein SLEP1_g55321 [Rubroshorea leprosula]|uniref:Uncharacterized protein n=1 Tax=Rubroshorea leprosula TaxID=152421 RepID=A0AAV5MI17_9ROSI|nr:hypothetical protein SLEP1_g55321 [Rubroshorea leprosula]